VGCTEDSGILTWPLIRRNGEGDLSFWWAYTEGFSVLTRSLYECRDSSSWWVTLRGLLYIDSASYKDEWREGFELPVGTYRGVFITGKWLWSSGIDRYFFIHIITNRKYKNTFEFWGRKCQDPAKLCSTKNHCGPGAHGNSQFMDETQYCLRTNNLNCWSNKC